MGNQQSGDAGNSEDQPPKSSERRQSRKSIVSAYTPALEKLFQKLELTAEKDNGHPGEITRQTFENVFHGPLQLFGKLLYRQMVACGHSPHHGSDKVKDRISCEQFVKAGKEVLKLFDESSQQKYYFKLFAEGKDALSKEGASKSIKDRILCEQFVKAGKEVLKLFDEASQQKYYFKLFAERKDTLSKEGASKSMKDRISCEQFVKASKEVLKLFDEPSQQKYYFKLFAEGKDALSKEGALVMVNVAYALTLSSSMISYSKTPADEQVFEAVVESMFGIKESISYHELEKWLSTHCRHLFCGVHNWVYTILTGSKMPSELESAPIPELEKFIEGKYCISMGILWLLSASLPYLYTHEKETEIQDPGASATKNPLLTSFQFIMKLARLNRCQSWTVLYDSDEHGLSMNRFSHHVTSYMEPNITLVNFEGRNIYCIAQDQPWRDGSGKFGGEDTVLLQITPVYRVIQSGGPMVLWNMSDRNLPTGIHVGKDGRATVLNIPKDFDSIKHYGVTCELHKVEMWGCGGQMAYQKQLKQKQWENREVEKARSRKLHMDVNWEDNPDKQLLSWGGVEVNHQYSRSGAM